MEEFKEGFNMAQATLSLCMIVKNEERFLEECLESVKDVVNQIVIVDTGSTDRTAEIARSYHAEVLSFPWQDDFAAARNESIKHATGDWILWMDADERLLPESKELLEQLLTQESKPLAYIVQIRNLLPDGKNYKLSSAHRLFNNHRGIQFSGRIHEQIAYSVSQLGGEERECAVTLNHLGYGLDDETQELKNIRNRRLLVKMVEEYPNNGYAHFTLAQHYGLTGLPQKALHHYKIAQRLNQFNVGMKATLFNTMAEVYVMMKNYERAKLLCIQSIQFIQQQVGAYYLLYRIALETNQLNEAIKWMEHVYERNESQQLSGKLLSTDVLINSDQLLFALGSLHIRAGNLTQAASHFEKMSGVNNRQAGEKLIPIYLNLNQYDKAENLLEQVLAQPNCDPRYRDMLGTVLIKQQKFVEAINVYEALNKDYPDNNSFVKRMAGLYAKTGNLARAQELLAGLDVPG